MADNFAFAFVDNPRRADAGVGYAGLAGAVSIRGKIQYVQDGNKYVLAGNGQMMLAESLAYQIRARHLVAQGQINAELLQGMTDRLSNTVSFHILLSYAVSTGMVVNFRAGDIIRVAEAENSDNWEQYLNVARAILGTTSARAQEALSANFRFVCLAVVACALHRHADSGHNWRQDQQGIEKSTASRCLRVAGGEIVDFSRFMGIHGHDLVHCMSNESLLALAEFITRRVPLEHAAHFRLNGVEVGRTAPALVLETPDSAIDRFPPNTVGVSSIVLGMDALHSMLAAIQTKLLVRGIGQVIAAVGQAKVLIPDFLNSERGTRDNLTHVRDAMAGVLAAASGFCEAYERDQYETGDSLKALAARNRSEYNSGKMFGRIMRELEASPQAVTEAIRSALLSVIDSLARAKQTVNEIEVPAAEFDIEEVALTNAQYRARVRVLDLQDRARRAPLVANAPAIAGPEAPVVQIEQAPVQAAEDEEEGDESDAGEE